MAEEVVSSLIGKVVENLIEKAKEEISYMSNCSQNVKNLESEIENLTLMKRRVQQKITAAKAVNGDGPLVGVKEWVDKAESHISEAKEVIDGFEADANKTCFNLGMCIDLGTRYRYGKKAANKASSLLQVQKDEETFGSCVSVPTPAPGVLDSYERHNIDDLETHKLCFEEIIKSIKDDNIQIIGIYGIGGVGKTTLAKEVAVEVRSLFDAVEFITVSQTVDAERIKKEVEATAKRIKNGEKILVILDDVWGALKLEEVGIPCGANYQNCKILLTSRSEDVCKTMKATGISVNILLENEAWILFKRVVGDTVDTDEKLKEIAKKIVEGCGGLPLIIQAVGAALKNESIESWKRALTRLQKRTTSYIDPKISLAYSHLQLSYDCLESEEAKSCFLLCSMFPDDYNIPLERLAYYGVGLEIFKDLDSMEDARNGVRHAVDILKSTCLLLGGKDESTVKMHDIVREVALLIASKGSTKFLVKAGIGLGLTEWQPRTKSVKSCTGISLMKNDISKLPDYELEIPLLNIFLIQGNDLSTIPDKFILGVKDARVLDFEDNKIVSLPPSLKQLTKLCTLNLGGNKSLRDISILGDLKSVEILILSHTGIVEIPQEIGDLVNLRRLEVKGCPGLSHIAPGVMSKLRWLEELHIAYYPVKDGNNESLVEIGTLSMLTFLDLFVPHIDLLPKGVFLTKLKGFVIQIGGRIQIYDVAEVVHKMTLILGIGYLDTPSMLQVKELIKLSDGIIFDSAVNPNNIVPTKYCESLDDLTTIMLSNCHNLLSLVDSSDWDVDEEELGGENTKKQLFSKLEHLFLLGLNKLHVLWKCPDQYISLKNLVTLHIKDCEKLVRLFSVNAARGLVNLKSLTINNCSSLEEVIWGEYDGDIDMVFHCLVKIELRGLQVLKSFYAGKAIIKFPSLLKVEISRCNALERLFSVNAVQGLVNLQTLTIDQCDSLKEVIWDGDEGDIDMVVFPCLVKIELLYLDDLKSFYAGKVIIRFPSLVKVEICVCNALERIFSVNAAQGLVNLKTLTIKSCSSLKEVIWDGDEGDIDMVVFHCLVKIELRYLEKLKSFYAGKAIIKFPSLLKVEIYWCDMMDKWGHDGTYVTPKLKLILNQKYSDLQVERVTRARFKQFHDNFVSLRAAMRFMSDANVVQRIDYKSEVMEAVGLSKNGPY